MASDRPRKFVFRLETVGAADEWYGAFAAVASRIQFDAEASVFGGATTGNNGTTTSGSSSSRPNASAPAGPQGQKGSADAKANGGGAPAMPQRGGLNNVDFFTNMMQQQRNASSSSSAKAAGTAETRLARRKSVVNRVNSVFVQKYEDRMKHQDRCGPLETGHDRPSDCMLFSMRCNCVGCRAGTLYPDLTIYRVRACAHHERATRIHN